MGPVRHTPLRRKRGERSLNMGYRLPFRLKVPSLMIRERAGMRTTVLDSDLYCSGDHGVAGVAVGVHIRIANRLYLLQNDKRKI